MKENKFNKLLKDKIIKETPKSFDDKIFSLVREEMDSSRKPLFDWRIIITPALAFSVFFTIFFQSIKNPIELNTNDPTIVTNIIENEELLENLEVFVEIESPEDFSDDDWNVLLAGTDDV